MPIPFLLLIAEIILFWTCVDQWGFGQTLLIYFAPCLLAFMIFSIWGRSASYRLQQSMQQGQMTSASVLHTLAILLSGICFLIPSFFSRVLGVILFLPGLRHLFLQIFKNKIVARMSQQQGPFVFGNFTFSRGFGSQAQSPFGDNPFAQPQEREVTNANVLDVKPLSISHSDEGENR